MLRTRMNLVRSTLAVVCGLAFAACGDGGDNTEPRLRNLVYCENPEVAAPSCALEGYSVSNDSALRAKLDGCALAGCHGDFSSTFSLDLSGSLEAGLSALTMTTSTSGDYIVDDFDPDCSNILTKVTDQPASGLRMPPAPYPSWSNDEIDCFRAYLNELYPQ